MTIFVTRRIAESGIRLLKQKGYSIRMYAKDQQIPRAELLKNVRGVDAILCLLTDKIDADVFETAGSRLKIVANYAVGFDNIDLIEARSRGIVVTNTPSDVVSTSVAEHAFGLMIALAHRIPEGDRFARAEKYAGWSPTLLTGTNLTSKTLGIIGAGRIGAELAKHAVHGFGMNVLYSDVERNTDLEKGCGAKKVSNTALFKQSDFISLHVPLLASTRHLVSREQFEMMKKTAYLINTSRGSIVDEIALLRALKAKKIAGVALDVFECEPAIDCDLTDTLALKQFPNVILTPHIASATIEAREEMSMIVAKNIIAVLSGKKPLNPADE